MWEFGVGLLLIATAKCPLTTWKSVFDRTATARQQGVDLPNSTRVVIKSAFISGAVEVVGHVPEGSCRSSWVQKHGDCLMKVRSWEVCWWLRVGCERNALRYHREVWPIYGSVRRDKRKSTIVLVKEVESVTNSNVFVTVYRITKEFIGDRNAFDGPVRNVNSRMFWTADVMQEDILNNRNMRISIPPASRNEIIFTINRVKRSKATGLDSL